LPAQPKTPDQDGNVPLFKKKSLAPVDHFGDTFKPQMTSLIDILTLLLVFLIQSFSAEGNLVTPSADLALPLSSSKKPARPSLMLELTHTGIVADGKQLALNESFASSGDFLVKNVYAWLLEQKATFGGATEAQRQITLQCDRELEFNIVKRVMFTCSKAGFTDFSVLVIEE
jgi:biopolymer transport protein ExbD